MSYYNRTPDQQRVSDLEYQLDEERRERERQQDERARADKERREEHAREAKERYRTATTWPEALAKQAHLMRAESYLDDETDAWFGDYASACDRGLVLWREIAATRADEIDALYQRLSEINDEIRRATGARLMAECDSEKQGWRQCADALLDDSTSLDAWLDW